MWYKKEIIVAHSLVYVVEADSIEEAKEKFDAETNPIDTTDETVIEERFSVDESGDEYEDRQDAFDGADWCEID